MACTHIRPRQFPLPGRGGNPNFMYHWR